MSGKTKDVEKQESTRKFRQFIRIRPLMEAEKNNNKKQEKPEVTSQKSAVEYKDGKVMLMDPKCLTIPKPMAKVSAKKTFTGYDGVFWSFGQDPWTVEGRAKTKFEESEDYDHEFHDQDHIYNAVKGDIVKQVFEGFNQTVCSYGPINSGKTYTMFGTDSTPGLSQRLIDDVIAAVPSEHKARQAPGENLQISVEAQCYRVYKEEIEDVLAGPHVLKGDYQKIPHTDVENATVYKLSEEGGLKKLADRLWGQKESVRRVSTVQSPNKSNRCSVVVAITVRQSSRFEGGGDEAVETEKFATLFLADIGLGGKADGESATDFGKVNKQMDTFKQVLRRAGERGQKEQELIENDKKSGGNGKVRLGKNAVHIPYNNSNLTRVLEEGFSKAHVTLICNISPYHKDHTETAQFLETATFGASAMGTAVQVQSKDLGEFRGKLEQKFEMQEAVKTEMKAHEKLSAELQSRLDEITSLATQLEAREKEEQDLKDDIARIEAKINELSTRIQSLREARKRLLASLDTREANAKATLKECKETIARLEKEVTESEEELKLKKAKVDEAMALIQRAAGLRSLLTGAAMEKDDGLRRVTDEDIANVKLEDASVFRQQAEDAISNLSEAVAKYEKVANMNEENTTLLKQIQEAMQEEQEADERLQEVEEAIKRRKRKCVREIIEAVEAVQRGPLEKLMKIVNENSNDSNRAETAKFYDEEANGICTVLGSNIDEEDEASLAPPGWCKYDKVQPVRPWIRSLHPSKTGEVDVGASIGSLETGSNDGTRKGGGPEEKFKVSEVLNDTIDSMKKLVEETAEWNYKLLQYHRERKTIEQAYEGWFEKFPRWPKEATQALKLLQDAKQVDSEVDRLRKEIEQLKQEIAAEEANLGAAQKSVKDKKALLERKKEELKKALDKCVIL